MLKMTLELYCGCNIGPVALQAPDPRQGHTANLHLPGIEKFPTMHSTILITGFGWIHTSLVLTTHNGGLVATTIGACTVILENYLAADTGPYSM